MFNFEYGTTPTWVEIKTKEATHHVRASDIASITSREKGKCEVQLRDGEDNIKCVESVATILKRMEPPVSNNPMGNLTKY